jgi:hypothetical protein
MGLCVSRTSPQYIDIGLDVGSRTTNFLRSAAELITMRSPVGATSDVLHDVPQRSGELRVLCEHGADHAEECGDVTRKSGGGLEGASRSARGGSGASLVEEVLEGGTSWILIVVSEGVPWPETP